MIYLNIISIFFNYLYIIYILVLAAFTVRTLRNSLYFVFLWQTKEYRLDRFFAHLNTSVGRKLLFGPVSSVKWVILISQIAGFTAIYFTGKLDYLPLFLLSSTPVYWLIIVFESIINIKEAINTGWRIPKLTLKSILILIPLYLIEFVPILLFDWGLLFIIAYLDKFLSLFIFALVAIVNIPSSIIKNLFILKARQKLKKYPDIKIIGITGSYGKTSTKEFLYTLLSEKFKVAKTPGFNNTDIGIAKYILERLNPKSEIFIVEMGAYKRGEIKTICNMVKPDTGILTGIGMQHLELFGSLSKIMETKSELIESLPESGMAFYNGNNKFCRNLYFASNNRKLARFFYSTSGNIKLLKILKKGLNFSLQLDGKIYKLELPVLGKHNLENLSAAITVSQKLGLTKKQILEGLKKIAPVEKTMKIVKSNHVTYVDDTFNAGKEAVCSALEYLSLYKGKKILILTPLIELDSKGSQIHRELGETAAKICDKIYLTNPNFYREMSEGIVNSCGDGSKLQLINKSSVNSLIHQKNPQDSIILFEGKESVKILNELLNK